MAKRSSKDARSQGEKFKDLAREIGADEDEESFKAKLKKLAKTKGGKPKGK